MRSTDERAARILRRTRELRRVRENRGTAGLAVLACALCVCLAELFRALSGGGRTGHVPEFYASALLYGGAGGYVLAGVLAFILGVTVTVLCIRHQKKNGGEK